MPIVYYTKNNTKSLPLGTHSYEEGKHRQIIPMQWDKSYNVRMSREYWKHRRGVINSDGGL